MVCGMWKLVHFGWQAVFSTWWPARSQRNRRWICQAVVAVWWNTNPRSRLGDPRKDDDSAASFFCFSSLEKKTPAKTKNMDEPQK